MDKKELRILQAAQGCEDTLKKRGIVAIAITVLGFLSGMFKGAGIIGGLEIIALFSLIIAPVCAVPYRIVSIATGRKVYLEDGDSLVIPSRLFGWVAAIAAFAVFMGILNFLSDHFPKNVFMDIVYAVLLFGGGAYWLYRDIKIILMARKVEKAYFSGDGAETTQPDDQAGEQTDFFAGCSDAASVKERYRSLMKIYHPDLQNGDTMFSQIINKQYEEQMEKQSKI